MKKQKNRLPSGKYRVRTRYKDADGTVHQKSFSANTKAEATAMMEEWKREQKRALERADDLPISEAVELYIETKRNVLSPATVKNYEGIWRTHLDDKPIGERGIKSVTKAELQRFVSELSVSHSPKTVKNVYGLVSSAIFFFAPERQPVRITFPQAVRHNGYSPSSDDVTRVIKYFEDKGDTDMTLACMLAAFGSLRRSEILALTDRDIKGEAVVINKALVEDSDGALVIKGPKTPESARVVVLPLGVISLAKTRKGRLVDITPRALTARFAKGVRESGVYPFRFHDLRHYCASIMHAVGIPDQYIMARGGWKTDNVMKSVYRNVISDEYVAQTEKINAYFSSIVAKIE